MFAPDAFSMMDLGLLVGGMNPGETSGSYRSMMEMMGATMTPAQAALVRSANDLHPMFFVFHLGSPRLLCVFAVVVAEASAILC